MAVEIAKEVDRAYLHPYAGHIPPAARDLFFARFVSGIAGSMCAYMGPERAKAVLREVLKAIDDAAAGRASTRH